MCNFAAELKHVAYREELVEIQRDNTFRREILKSSKKGAVQVEPSKCLFSSICTFAYFRKTAMYRLNSLNADIQLIVDGASVNRPPDHTCNLVS